MSTVQDAPVQTSVEPDEQDAVQASTPNKAPVAPPICREQLLEEALTLLGALFDQAMVRANAVRARTGWPAPITLEHQVGERCYYTFGQHGKERTLSLFIALPLLDGDIFGGAFIQAGDARSPIFVVPVLNVDPVRPLVDAEPILWIVQASGAQLSEAIVYDLFLLAFNDDTDAAKRLKPHFGLDLFATPWS